MDDIHILQYDKTLMIARKPKDSRREANNKLSIFQECEDDFLMFVIICNVELDTI